MRTSLLRGACAVWTAAAPGGGGGSRRSPMVAGFLGIVPGLGHVYAGESRRGFAVAAVRLGSGMVMFGSEHEVANGSAAVVNTGSYVFSIADGALAAVRSNRRRARPARRTAADST